MGLAFVKDVRTGLEKETLSATLSQIRQLKDGAWVDGYDAAA